ncbi:DNA internalization-related competence protein ComEC/Rec2 [Vibrio pectenicida]|uniref:DNA internalization-related competence protein ComEC/Rec2 n=1 Tax=Vibrio pectenicida TaxID=62763 RepID=A0A7Y4ECU1_9VIBR|nr:DNA internalization-related competence protein ComEC/Rec2 [Vibrio pectenicida]
MTLSLNYWTLISFCFLISSISSWWYIPSWKWLFPCILILIFSIRLKLLRWGLGSVVACLILVIHSNFLRHQQGILFQAGQNITINAEVDSFFKQVSHGFQGEVTVTSINGKQILALFRPRIWLVSPTLLTPNDEIRAQIKVKPIVGLLNDVGFDAEKYALQKRIVGRAHVLANRSYWVRDVASLRYEWFKKIASSVDELPSKGIIFALTFGMRDELLREVKQRLKSSGLSHIIAISGLHIGIVFSIGWFIGKAFFRVFHSWGTAPILIAVLLSGCYAWLAGFSIPTQRAMWACCLMSLLLTSLKRIPSSYQWLIILSWLLLIDPFSSVSASLWLTMWAVAIILLFMSLQPSYRSYWKKALVLQFSLVVGMMPAIAMLFYGVSLSSFLYNILFVSWFSLVVVPSALLALLLDIGFDITFLWNWVDWTIQPVFYAITFAEKSWLSLANQQVMWLCSLIALCAVAPFFSWRGKGLLLTCLLTVLIDWRSRPIWQAFVLDVGHGLAVVIKQGQSAIIYDTGMAWQESSIAERIITPFLHYHGIKEVDILILSHADNDHAGGMETIIESWNPKNIVSSQKSINGRKCIAGQKMVWGVLDIEFIWPNQSVFRAYNPHSCVVKVIHQDTSNTLLLPGDIDAVVEWMLVRHPKLLSSDILVVPHHGSRTSSINQFIKVVGPDLAIASTAKTGKWSLPDQKVVKRYAEANVDWLDTGTSGQISISFYRSHWSVDVLREGKGQSWYRQMLRKGVE